MTKKLRLLLIAVFAFIAFVCLFAGCSLKPSLKEVLDDLDSKGAVVDVTYFANEGSFAGNTKITNLRQKVGSKAVNINTHAFTSGDISVSRTKHKLVGWYEAETYTDPETGNVYPIYEDGSVYKFDYDTKDFDTTKNIKRSEVPFDFNTVLEKGVHYYLVAEWEKVYTVPVKLAGEVSSITVKDDGEDTEYKFGNLINDIPYETINDKLVIPSKPSPILGTVSGATFVEFYYKETCEKEDIVKWPLYLENYLDDDYDDFAIYAKYIEGIWTVVRDSDGVKSMFDRISVGNQYYIFDDITYDGNTIDAITGSDGFACTIRGNGFTISGLKITATFRTNQTNSASLFGAIKGTANIRDLNLEVEEIYTVNTNATALGGIYFAFTSIASGATIENVNLSGTMTVKVGTGWKIKNIGTDGSSVNWKFGGYDDDSLYTGGIKVADSATLNLTDN